MKEKIFQRFYRVGRFASEKRNLGVSGEHIDAFCGRIPRSVRAKHYTDYSPERLKEVYEKASITVLS
ncbi:hypothetical protein AKJ64_01635 [candidate division MSBL1 archaeon SCGC-AAA259E17]|uniref:Integrase SSV1 C-terminal domain-containing protein n=1 Tax=candidate division MSBL1 archaeon SCGC-AAA259E17 TaxID=1698263 RepID=A0A133UFQ6_9EURY|nr:hypothetical protein AKJ64_01635 [candidate division MSBL1 archaeon SCGC-AAA259E17]